MNDNTISVRNWLDDQIGEVRPSGKCCACRTENTFVLVIDTSGVRYRTLRNTSLKENESEVALCVGCILRSFWMAGICESVGRWHG